MLFVYFLVVQNIEMSKKRYYNLEEALQKILEPGTDSEIEELESNTEHDTSNNTVTTLTRIGDDLEQPDPSDLLATENYVENETTVGEVDGENIFDDVEPECDNNSIDLSKIFETCSSMAWQQDPSSTWHSFFLQ